MNKKQKKVIASLVMASLVVAICGYYPGVNNANAINSLTDAKATITNSAPGAASTITLNFTSATTTQPLGSFRVDMPATNVFGSLVGKVTCGGTLAVPPFSASVINGNDTAVCTNNTAGAAAAGSGAIITLAGLTNPLATTSQVISISHLSPGGAVLERVQVVVQIINTVWMTARVDSTLNFSIHGTSTGALVNDVSCTATSSATSTPFGTLSPTAPSVVCQELRVVTNASGGFTVTVQQDGEMISDAGDNINSFNNATTGTGSTTAVAWAVPANILDNDDTYGHMGLTSNDANLVAAYPNQDYYNGGVAPYYAGLNGVAPIAVFNHDGPSDGLTQNKGMATVAYKTEISSLQQAGDYESTLTYIATPTY